MACVSPCRISGHVRILSTTLPRPSTDLLYTPSKVSQRAELGHSPPVVSGSGSKHGSEEVKMAGYKESDLYILLLEIQLYLACYLAYITLLARFLDPLNEASRLDEHRSISAFVWRCCLATS